MKIALTSRVWMVLLAWLVAMNGVAFSGDRSGVGGPEDRQVVDFNGDGLVDIKDLNELLLLGPLSEGFVVEPGAPFVYDLNRDGRLDVADVSVWLADAAAINHMSHPYQMGDGNLDGQVNSDDFKLWEESKFSSSLAWDDGDFNCDGLIDVSDFNVWNASRSGAVSWGPVVPEPASAGMLACAILWIVFAVRFGQSIYKSR